MAVLILAAVVVAKVVEKRRPRVTSSTKTYAVPKLLDRNDFEHPAAPWLVAAFTSATCSSCDRVRRVIAPLASPDVVVADIEIGAQPELHERYGIEAVPTVVVADEVGEVRASFLGVPTAADLWASVAELREPGSVPPGCDHEPA